jgi:hypothetical protein
MARASLVASALVLAAATACSEAPTNAADASSDGGADADLQIEAEAAPVVTPDAAPDATSEAGPGTPCLPAGSLCWGFEEGTIPPGWMRYRNGDGFPGQLVVDTTRPHSGAYALHAKNYMGGSPDQQGGPKYTITYALPAGFGPVLWGRAYVYTTPAAPESHAGFFNARYPRPGTSTTLMQYLDWYEVATDSPEAGAPADYMAIWHPPEPPGQPEDVRISGAGAVVDGWACVEWLFDASGAPDAEAAEPRVWLNGVELSWPTTFSYPAIATPPFRETSSSFVELETGVYMYQGLTAVTNWWIDDLAVGPQRIGCLP